MSSKVDDKDIIKIIEKAATKGLCSDTPIFMMGKMIKEMYPEKYDYLDDEVMYDVHQIPKDRK